MSGISRCLTLVRIFVCSPGGMVRAGKTYARTFAPAMSRAEFYAGMVTNALTKKELVEFRRAMRQLANEDSESSDEEA